MKIKNRLPLLFIMINLFATLTMADFMSGAFINPGVKIGYQFGRNGGLIIGIENSVTYAVSMFYAYTGLVGGIELNVKKRKFIEYWEIEGGLALVGIAFGGEWNHGYYGSFRIFSGALGFISYKHLLNTKTHEIAFVGKYPYEMFAEYDHGTYRWGKRIGP
jgi:hypothetical protein